MKSELPLAQKLSAAYLLKPLFQQGKGLTAEDMRRKGISARTLGNLVNFGILVPDGLNKYKIAKFR